MNSMSFKGAISIAYDLFLYRFSLSNEIVLFSKLFTQYFLHLVAFKRKICFT